MKFGSVASSVYHGLTVWLHRRMTQGLYFRMAYTFAHAYDDGQDALVAGRPATVHPTMQPLTYDLLAVSICDHA